MLNIDRDRPRSASSLHSSSSRPISKVRSLAVACGLATLAWLIGACADGGGGSGGGEPTSTGSVAVLLTDAPIDDFVKAWVTVTRIDLLGGDDGDGGRVTIFEGEETFDLLALENVSEPFAIADDVPSGKYSKIRMDVTDIELIRKDGFGGYESVFPELPGGDRIDLNPQGGFHVEAGEMLTIRLDVDAKRSIHVNETGNGKVLFRSQVFVEILDAERPGRLIFVEGIVEEIESGDRGSRIRLCEVAIHRRSDSRSSDRDCIAVFVGPDASIFDSSGLPTDDEEIDRRDLIAVFGRFRKAERDSVMSLALDAEVVELGGSDAFLTLRGEIESGIHDDEDAEIQPLKEDAVESILVDLDEGQGFVVPTTLEALIFDETKVFSRDGTRLRKGVLEEGKRTELDGVLLIADDEDDALRTAIIFVAEPRDDLEPEPRS